MKHIKTRIVTSVLTIGEISIVFDKLELRKLINSTLYYFQEFLNDINIIIKASKACMELNKPLADVIHIVSSINKSSLFVTADRDQKNTVDILNIKAELT